MLVNHLRYFPNHVRIRFSTNQKRFHQLGKVLQQSANPQEVHDDHMHRSELDQSKDMGITPAHHPVMGEIFPTTSPRVMPMVLSNESVVLPFDAVPGPRVLKYVSQFRHYLSEVGTQATAVCLRFGLNVGTYLGQRKPFYSLSSLFDKYGPVVRFVSPVGRDIVLINHPDHIQKVFAVEGDQPVRSTLDSLEKYRIEHRNLSLGGIYSLHGPDWSRQRAIIQAPLHNAVTEHVHGLSEVCESFTLKVYNLRNYQDEVRSDLFKEINKWAFDCMGLLIFSKKFTMLDTEFVYSQCDMSWLYHSLQKSTDAIVKCESGLHMWKLLPTPAWNTLVKYCDSLDNLIGKHVLEAEKRIPFGGKNESECNTSSLINAMLAGEDKMRPEDIATVLMDMLLIGVNTIASSMSFLLYHLAKHQRSQKLLYQEIDRVFPEMNVCDVNKMKEEMPYLQGCIKENLRLVPPIPVLSRVLPKNITLDRYNIPRGTLIIMSTQDASLKESNFEEATKFSPERWLKPDAKDYHAFASIPFGFGARKCLGQSIAETLMSMLTIKILQKYKMEYHYGDIYPTKTFISKPNRALKLRFIDRGQ